MILTTYTILILLDLYIYFTVLTVPTHCKGCNPFNSSYIPTHCSVFFHFFYSTHIQQVYCTYTLWCIYPWFFYVCVNFLLTVSTLHSTYTLWSIYPWFFYIWVLYFNDSFYCSCTFWWLNILIWYLYTYNGLRVWRDAGDIIFISRYNRYSFYLRSAFHKVTRNRCSLHFK